MTHHTAHFRTADLNERLDQVERDNPNSTYWFDKATLEYGKLRDLLGSEQAFRMIADIEGTWKFKHDAIKELVIRWKPSENVLQTKVEVANDLMRSPWDKTVELGKRIEQEVIATVKQSLDEPANIEQAVSVAYGAELYPQPKEEIKDGVSSKAWFGAQEEINYEAE